MSSPLEATNPNTDKGSSRRLHLTPLARVRVSRRGRHVVRGLVLPGGRHDGPFIRVRSDLGEILLVSEGMLRLVEDDLYEQMRRVPWTAVEALDAASVTELEGLLEGVLGSDVCADSQGDGLPGRVAYSIFVGSLSKISLPFALALVLDWMFRLTDAPRARLGEHRCGDCGEDPAAERRCELLCVLAQTWASLASRSEGALSVAIVERTRSCIAALRLACPRGLDEAIDSMVRVIAQGAPMPS